MIPGEPKDIVDDDEDSAIQPGMPLPEPITPTAIQVAAHNLTHLPYRSWCSHCVRARRANSHHRSIPSSRQRTTPLLVADYCFVRDCQDKELATVLVGRLYPSKALFAVVCDQKGVDNYVVTRLAHFIRDSGHSHIVYRSDQERSIRAMFEEAFRLSHRQGSCYNPKLQQFVPEESSVGESQSNGKAESTVQRLEDMIRTYKSALEDRIKFRIPSNHALTRWIVDHAASVYNRHVCNADGATPYEAIHGQKSTGKLCEFGEVVFYYVPKRIRSKMDLRFRIGVFLGNSQNSNEAFVGISNGNVIKSRSIVRVIAPSRWDKDTLSKVIGVPGNLTPTAGEEIGPSIEEQLNPHENADDDIGQDEVHAALRDGDKLKKIDRQIRLTVQDFKRHGWTDGCPRCIDLQAGAFHTARHHTDECRLRMYTQFREANSQKWRKVKHLIEPEPDGQFQQKDIDLEGAQPSVIPQALDGANLLEASASHEPILEPDLASAMEGVDAEQVQAGEAADIVIANEQPEEDVHDLFMGDEDDNDDAMMSALMANGVNELHAKIAALSMNQREPTATFIEVYGRSIRDQSLHSRRNLNIEGLDALDLRTTKPNGEPWNFLKREDRKKARKLIEDRNPDWLLGAPPCTPFSIWNYAMNYKKMDPDRVREMLDEGRLHLNSNHKRQIRFARTSSYGTELERSCH